MKKLLLSLTLTCSLFAATEAEMLSDNLKSTRDFKEHTFSVIKKLETTISNNEQLNEIQGDVNKYQEKINSDQSDINKQYKEDLSDLGTQLNTLRSSIQSNINSGSANRFTDEKINRLDDKIYRLERNISDQDSRIRKLEMKVR